MNYEDLYAGLKNVDTEYRDVYVESENGNAFGYVVTSSAEQIYNWLGQRINHHQASQITNFIRQTYTKVAILKNLNVDAEYQGQGIGSNLLDSFLNDADADIVLLVSDAFETQRKGFILRNFYENRDFMELTQTKSGPLMIFPSDETKKLRDYLANPPSTH